MVGNQREPKSLLHIHHFKEINSLHFCKNNMLVYLCENYIGWSDLVRNVGGQDHLYSWTATLIDMAVVHIVFKGFI